MVTLSRQHEEVGPGHGAVYCPNPKFENITSPGPQSPFCFCTEKHFSLSLSALACWPGHGAPKVNFAFAQKSTSPCHYQRLHVGQVMTINDQLATGSGVVECTMSPHTCCFRSAHLFYGKAVTIFSACTHQIYYTMSFQRQEKQYPPQCSDKMASLYCLYMSRSDTWL